MAADAARVASCPFPLAVRPHSHGNGTVARQRLDVAVGALCVAELLTGRSAGSTATERLSVAAEGQQALPMALAPRSVHCVFDSLRC